MSSFWKKAMLRGSAFGGSYRKLKMLYAVEDPWNMASDREQHRFIAVNEQLSSIQSRYGTVLEIGSGEGHQSVHLSKLAGKFYGVDLSAKAIERASRRCPDGVFAPATMESAHEVVEEARFDLITLCEVMYYARRPEAILPPLQARADRLYVTNYLPRSEKMRHHFEGEGWRRLDDIKHDRTVWECFLWEAPAIAARRLSGAKAWIGIFLSAATADACFVFAGIE